MITSTLVSGCAQQAYNYAPVADLSDPYGYVDKSVHIVQKGDTLYSIAWGYGRDYRDIAAYNGISAPYTIYPGQALRLNPRALSANTSHQTASPQPVAPPSTSIQQPEVAPASSPTQTYPLTETNTPTYPLSEPETLPPSPQPATKAPAPLPPTPEVNTPPQPQVTPPPTKVEVSPPKPTATETSSKTQTPAAEPASPPVVKGLQENFAWAWPTQGKVISGFDLKNSLNRGIDISGKLGQAVKAAGPGIVVYAGSGVRGYGNLVILKHNDRYFSAYGHNSELLVQEGQEVAKGEVIARMGATSADQIKLHFEIRENGNPIDPLKLLPKS
ncbi:peptidoglycan DD-metalloendopeptidase family protein [Allopseudospirillum japonicum]|uniref:peptidoglycan DD-metalloendopeptidase family protein n=1 Tax=Allopseudospirillum japonicum TaxID=64971 RepID=UPI00115FD0C6|nr:peptidoglycan DD-metalloendopeptidase family protein [Allopseudospirillum japonicum]